MKTLLNKKHLASFIDGQFITHDTKKSHLSVINKSTLTTLSFCNTSDIKQAINSSIAAQNKLDELDAYQRAAILEKAASLLLKHKNDISQIITHEVGKPISESKAEVEYAASYFNWFSEEAKRILSTSYPSRHKNTFLLKSYKRIGPCFFITPWNFPLVLAARKIAASIAAGCSCVLKPCNEAPITSLILGYILQQANLPDGALNILIGDAIKISKIVLEHPEIKKISFTGSKEVGKELYCQSSKTLKKLTLELGGNAPFIVFDDADIDAATDAAIFAKFRNGGQTCIAANRFLIQKTVFDDFVNLFAKKISKLAIGDPLHLKTSISKHLHPSSIKKIKAHKNDALKKGAKAILASKDPFEPELYTNVKQNMLIASEENFGPIAPCLSFKTDDEAYTMANATSYGLAAYAFTTSLQRASQIKAKLDFGMIGINTGSISMAESSFGGMKHSGFGREGGMGGIYEYLVETMIVEKI